MNDLETTERRKTFLFQTILFKNGNQSSTVATATQTIAKPVILTLYQQGGKSSSVFIRLAGVSGNQILT